MYARLFVGLALVLLAAAGPYFGLRGAMVRSRADGALHGEAEQGRVDHRLSVLVALRIFTALLGLWLIIFSSAQLLHGHGQLRPQDTQPAAH